MSDRTWPANHGEADVCLWDDDKLAALSVTIDDNWVSDHNYWKSLTEKYGFHFTWFVMVDDVSFWIIWQRLFDVGHDVQGHDFCKINDYSNAEYESILVRTRDILERMVVGNRALTYAYPCGDAKVHISKKVFIACRGTVGGRNQANQINYLNTRVQQLNGNNIDAAITNRDWMHSLFHGVGSEGTLIDSTLSHAKRREPDLWVTIYSKAARYGQSRDTHTLTVTSVQDTAVAFTVTDSMNDTLFNYPLCVKVRVNNNWEYARARQNTLDMDASVIEHQGSKYVLVKAIPDRGPVTLTKSSEPVSGIKIMKMTLSNIQRGPEIFFNCRGKRVREDTMVSGIYLKYDGSKITKMIIVNTECRMRSL